MNTLELILDTLISVGIITALLSHWYDKKLCAYEIKLQRYVRLMGVLADLFGNEEDIWGEFRKCLNEALIFASDEVVREILEFNKKYTQAQRIAGKNNFQMTATDIQPLVIAIRKDLNLKSKSICKNGLRFFQKPLTQQVSQFAHK